jgi:hypothetical protein
VPLAGVQECAWVDVVPPLLLVICSSEADTWASHAHVLRDKLHRVVAVTLCLS